MHFLIEQIDPNCPGFGWLIFWLKFLYLCSSVRLTYNFPFFVMLLPGLGIRIVFASKNKFGCFLIYFGRVSSITMSTIKQLKGEFGMVPCLLWWSLCKIGFIFCIKYLIEFVRETIWAWSFPCWKVFHYRPKALIELCSLPLSEGKTTCGLIIERYFYM